MAIFFEEVVVGRVGKEGGIRRKACPVLEHETWGPQELRAELHLSLQGVREQLTTLCQQASCGQ